MVQRLFLYRIHIGCDNFAISVSNQAPSVVLPHPTEPEFRIGNLAVVVAQETVNFAVLCRLIEHGFFRHS